MPLTDKGEKVMKAMQAKYGAEKGRSVFYASANAGKISGVGEEGRGRGTRESKMTLAAAQKLREALMRRFARRLRAQNRPGPKRRR